MQSSNVTQKQIFIIGSSPALMFEAIARGNLGHDVTVIERSNEIGGAWTTTNIGDWVGVDIGPHSLPLDDRGLRFVDQIGLEYDLDRDKDFVLLKKPILGMTSLGSRYKLLAGSINGSADAPYVKRLFVLFLGFLQQFKVFIQPDLKAGKKNIFPRRGLSHLLNTISQMATKACVRVILNQEVELVEFDTKDRRVVIRCRSGKTFPADCCIFSSYTDVSTITVDGSTVDIPAFISDDQTQLQLVIKDSLPASQGGRGKFPKDDPIGNLLKDLTLYIDTRGPKPDGHRLLVLFLKNEVPADDDGVEIVMEALKSYCVLGKDAQLIASEWIFTNRKRRRPESWDRLSSQVGDLFGFIKSHPFGHSINENAEHWLKCLRARKD